MSDTTYTISPHIKSISAKLPAVFGLIGICAEAGLIAESMQAGALVYSLAELVEGDTPPGSAEHAEARAILNGDEGVDAP